MVSYFQFELLFLNLFCLTSFESSFPVSLLTVNNETIQQTSPQTTFSNFPMPTQVVSLVHVVPSATSPIGVAVCSASTTPAGFFLVYLQVFFVND
jgi:hypothetical protein